MTVLDVITYALQDLGVLDGSETSPAANDAAFGLVRLNRLLDQWAAESLFIYTVTRTTWTLIASQGTYSVGSGGDVNRVRPVFIQNVNFVDTSMDPDLEMPLSRLTNDAYAAIPQKALTSTYPTSWFYNPTFPAGAITFWPIPTSSTLQGAFYAGTATPRFTAGSDSFTLPPGYERMIVTNLAVEMAPSYLPPGTPISPALIQAAIDSKAAVQRANIKLADMAIDPGALPQRRVGVYSIFSDTSN